MNLLTVDQVSERLQTCKVHVYRLIRSGEIAASNIASGKRAVYRVAESDLLDWLRRSNTTNARPKRRSLQSRHEALRQREARG